MKGAILKYAFAAGAVIGAVVAVIFLLRKDEETQVRKGPEETVESFCRAMAAGDMDSAYTLCDTICMRNYIEAYQARRQEFEQQDSSAAAIASAILSGSEFTVLGTEKDGEIKTVTYALSFEGHRKERKATVRKEEGEWKVTGIEDVI